MRKGGADSPGKPALFGGRKSPEKGWMRYREPS
nr:MAG TPA: hypothetical protein [Caudoviricetes sp.]